MTAYIPASGEFVFVVRDGVIQYPGQAVNVDHLNQEATIRPVGEDVDPVPVPFTEIRRHPLSTQRGIEES